MSRHGRVATTVFGSLCVLLVGCGGSDETATSDAVSTDNSAPAGETAGSTTTSTTVAVVSTLPPDPSIFNPNTIGDPLDLGSFVFTTEEFHSFNGTPNARTTTTGYIKDPISISVVSDFHDGSGMQEYYIGGRTYQNNNQNYWYLYDNESPAAPSLLEQIRGSQGMSGVLTATFVGPEDYFGVAAYHYTFDETNLQNYSSYTPENPSPEVEGDFYLAQEGNYVLYAHSRQVAAGADYELIDEFTDTMSSVNQFAEIVLPDDLLPLKEALDAGALLGIPMPADAATDSMINYNQGGVGVYYYQFTSSWKNEAEFMEYYTNLQPTNGWSVSWIGQVENLDPFCGDGNCVIINNGDKQVILYFDGSNLHADWDREHRFGPCTQPISPTACG
ncbi:MAG: hypothetical protein K8R99_04820 [Actinomycetia bacterium]|nr:hypothetical protein [Actinomycetes bacterium]